MLEHRLREWFANPVAVGVADPAVAFVPCPCSMFVGFGPTHASFVGEVYRIARELTEAQMREPTRSRMPEFSRN